MNNQKIQNLCKLAKKKLNIYARNTPDNKTIKNCVFDMLAIFKDLVLMKRRDEMRSDERRYGHAPQTDFLG